MATTALFNDDDLQVLARTQAVRLQIVDHFTGPDSALPRNQGEWGALHQALDGLDRTVFTKAKLKNDEENSQQRQQVMDIVTHVLQRTTAALTAPNPNPVTPLLDTEYTVETVPGEMDIGLHEMTYDSFMASAD